MNRYVISLLAFLLPHIAFSEVCDVSRGDVCNPPVAPPAPLKLQSATLDPSRPNSPPEYPRYSLRHGEEGIIDLTLTVEADGTVTAPEIRVSSGFSRLDSAALSAVTKWNFIPAQQDGKPIKKTYEQEIQFWIVGHSWMKVDHKSDTVEVYARSHLFKQSGPVKDGQNLLVLFNFRQLETPEGGRKTKYSHGMSVLVNREMNCSSKTFRDVVTTAWSEHWAKGELVGSEGAGGWKDTNLLASFCEPKEKK